jgi:hypothetical protein
MQSVTGPLARRADCDDPQQPRAQHEALGRPDLTRIELERRRPINNAEGAH